MFTELWPVRPGPLPKLFLLTGIRAGYGRLARGAWVGPPASPGGHPLRIPPPPLTARARKIKMRKPKTLQFRLSLASNSGIVKEVIANYVLIKRLVGAVIFRGFYNHKRHKRRRTEDGVDEPGSFAFFSPPNIRLYTYVTNIFKNEGTPVPTYLPFISTCRMYVNLFMS